MEAVKRRLSAVVDAELNETGAAGGTAVQGSRGSAEIAVRPSVSQSAEVRGRRAALAGRSLASSLKFAAAAATGVVVVVIIQIPPGPTTGSARARQPAVSMATGRGSGRRIIETQ